MLEPMLIVIALLLAAVVVLQIVLLRKKVEIDLSPVDAAFKSVQTSYERTERAVRDEIARNRQEASNTSKQGREELAAMLKGVGDTLDGRLGDIRRDNNEHLDKMREEANSAAKKAREEVTAALKTFSEFLDSQFTGLGSSQRTHLGNVLEQLTRLTETNENKLEAQRTAVDKRLEQIQTEQSKAAQQMRDEVGKLIKSNQQELDSLRNTVEAKLKYLQEDNSSQLEKIRNTVDEKLQTTLDKRLGESFKQVSERLQAVFEGLGQMQVLAIGVGDLKKVLTNVKTRGTWAEVQLGAMLEQVLAPEQYAPNVATKGGGERVEFAVRLPGRTEDSRECVWLPIDAKFPKEDYERLVEAQDKADPEAARQAAKDLEDRIKGCAKDICEKYIGPPQTTDFAILFLPTEGLFAEVVRRPGLCGIIQEKYRVVIAGPTTLWALLNALQMGFKTLAIQRSSSDVRKLLVEVKNEFATFGKVIGKVHDQLTGAAKTIEEDVARRTRVINRKLKSVEELPANQAPGLLTFDAVEADGDGEEG